MANSDQKLLMIFMFSLMLITIAKSDSLSFNYPRFTPGLRNLLLDGEDSSISDEALHLTKTDPNTGKALPDRSGLAAFFGAVRLFNNRTGKVADFTTEFTFTVKTNGVQPHGDGFTFFLASLDYEFPDNSSGGFLGVFGSQTAFNASANQVVAVEFDTFGNTWDPPYSPYPHIGIDVNSVRSVATAKWPMDSEPDGAIGKASIRYGSSSKLLSVIVSYPNSTVPVTTLSYPVDFANALQSEWALVGFSASTGDLVETHDILSWYFRTSL
ncbi:lectin 5 [Arachis duranensis]|uniref:Lectin 5 n=1 Tax=Arachis duranensis TaxID=130453 RepID=A0A6P4DDP1_ARADU|nr:lectin 5 [Arachis duranensis]XP_057763073.1 lectin 5-like [Arachis stenosperma]